MALWIDSNNKLHDDMGGDALLLPNWPKGMTLATPDQIASITAPKKPTIDEINAPIIAQLAEIDKKTIRPLREGDTARVAALDAEAAALRAQLVK